MAMNRLDRDGILNAALDMADSAVLDNKDRPSGAIVAAALSIGWLQRGLDYFHKKFPFSADITSVAFSLASAGTNTFSVPSTFILDYLNGVVLDDNEGRLIRKGLGYILNRPTGTGSYGKPEVYALRGTTIQVYPPTNKARTGTLYYYSLPALLTASVVPIFPDDDVLVTFVWLKAQEFHRAAPPGAAMQFADKQIAELQRSGIGPEAEEDALGIDSTFARQPAQDPTSWMGKPVL